MPNLWMLIHMQLLLSVAGLQIPKQGKLKQIAKLYHQSVYRSLVCFFSISPASSLYGSVIGVYLSQLQRHSKLPDLIDPTAPNEAVGVNQETSNFDAPAHPEVFSALAPLPMSMHLEPLINVHKQRRIAGVIKALVAGQHLASRVKFDIDKRLFQKCLRLRGLDSDMLQRALAVYAD